MFSSSVNSIETELGRVGTATILVPQLSGFLTQRANRCSTRVRQGLHLGEWGEGHPDSRGGRVLDMASRIGLVILST